jgi:hypothetical protein
MYRAVVHMSGVAGAPYYSVMNFSETGGTAQQAANAARQYWLNFQNLMRSGLLVTVLPEVRRVNEVTGALQGVESVTITPFTCADSAEAMPPATQGLCRWITGVVVGKRLLRGRTFIPALTQFTNNGGVPDAALITAMNAAATQLIGDANSAFQVWHRPTTAESGDGTGGVVTSHSAWTQFAQQRGRRD